MHTPGAGANAVPAFLTKLWKLVDDPSCDDLISWSSNGSSFIIHNQSRFSKELLPLYFKHNNLASFIRQLNMYGFRKVVHLEQNGLRDDMEFYHHLFVKGSESLLSLIKRKVPVGRATGENVKVKPDLIESVLENVQNIQGRQEHVDVQLANMKRENEALWREVALLRQKHLKQQQIVERLIQFLVTLVQPGCNVGLKRKQPLMIDTVNKANPKKPRISKTDPFSHITTNIQFSVDPTSPVNGPVIHDVTESMEASEFLKGTAHSSPVQQMVSVDSPLSTSGGNVESPASVNVGSPVNEVEQVELLDLLNPLETGTVASLDATCGLSTPSVEIRTSTPSPNPLRLDVTKTIPLTDSLNTPPPIETEMGPLSLPEDADVDPEASLSTPLMTTEPSLTLKKQDKSCNKSGESTSSDASKMQVAVTDNQPLGSFGHFNDFENEWKQSTQPNTKSSTIADHVDNIAGELESLKDYFPSVGLDVDPSFLLGVCQQPWDSWLSSNIQLFSSDDPLPCGNMITEGDEDIKGKAGQESIQCTPDIAELDWEDAGSSLLSTRSSNPSNRPKTTATNSVSLPLSTDDFLSSPTSSLDKEKDETNMIQELFGDALGAKISEVPSSTLYDDVTTTRELGAAIVSRKKVPKRRSKKSIGKRS